ncbi:hypothetical protein [Candidatus Cyanaurora vandensis]|uniref:hypothetical protein n=1 Tax=Candidatus Cyanaurora vandensis TaxID=2714958 RepID=UPI00257E962A|nr:hypothetical protein [Candidatus Cyanaurora vandensis]
MIDAMQKTDSCPSKRNRLVDDTQGAQPAPRVRALTGTETELDGGKVLKRKKFPGDQRVKRWRVTVCCERRDDVVPNHV